MVWYKYVTNVYCPILKNNKYKLKVLNVAKENYCKEAIC